MTDAIIGYGTTVEVQNGETTPGWEFIGEITNITPPNESVDQVDVTHMESPGRTREFIQGLIDPGEMSLDLNHVPGSATDDLILEWRTSGETRSMRITYPNNVTETFPAFVLGYAPSGVAVADALTATLTVKVAGAIVRGVAS